MWRYDHFSGTLAPSGMLECFCKSRLSFTGETRKFGREFSDCRIKVPGDRTAMNVASRQREARTGGKALSCAAGCPAIRENLRGKTLLESKIRRVLKLG